MARWLSRRRTPARTTPLLSVVMPVYNAESTLAECLSRVYQSTFEDFEFVLVDDGSTDQTRAIANNFPVRIVPTNGRVGPAAARNLGARVAEGEYVFFIDSDVMLRSDTLERLVVRFREGDVDGLLGVQAVDMRFRDLVSQYKNLWMRWTYLRQQGNVPLFYTSAAGIHRETFLRAGGFDQGYTTPNVEDTAFGQKLAKLGIRVQVLPDLEYEHVKRYSLGGLLRTDFMRAVSLTRLKLRNRGEIVRNNTSVPGGYVASIPLTGLAALCAVAALALRSPALGAAALAAAAGVVALNREFLTTIRRTEGWARALGAVPLLLLELFVAGAGLVVGLATYPFGRRY
jgi:GT2 family glycosyltransferase